MNKTIVVYEEESWSGTFRGVPENVRDFTAWLDTQLASVPAEHFSTTAVIFSGPGQWGDDDPSMRISISYVRPETAAEQQLRTDADAGAAHLQQAEERATLQRLLRKYPLDTWPAETERTDHDPR